MEADPVYRLNSSNPDKVQEFSRFFGVELKISSVDLPEPVADPLTVVRFKASQFESVLIDDTSLEVEGAEIGIEVRWKLSELSRLAGSRANFVCLLALHEGGKVLVYRGCVAGKLVTPRGQGFGFNPYFQPDGSDCSLAEKMEDRFNARFHAVQALITGKVWKVLEPLFTWEGEFQKKKKG